MLTKTKIVKLILASETLYLTIHDRPITIDSNIYTNTGLIDDIEMNFSISMQADTAFMSIIKLSDKQYQGAILEIYDYDLETKTLLMPACFIGQVMATEIYDVMVTLKAYSSKRLLNKRITRTYDKPCQAEWGGNRCKINKDLYKQQIQIIAITDNIISYHVLSGTVTDFYNPYVVDLVGYKINIFDHDKILQKFKSENSYLFQIGHIYHLYAGCQKNILNCYYYNNLINYFGFDKIN